MEIVNQQTLLLGVYFVDCEKKRVIRLAKETNEFEIGRGQFGPSIDHHDDGRCFIERNSRLAEDLGGNKILLFGQNAASIDDSEYTAVPFCITVEAISRDAGLVAHDRSSRSDDAV